jgi:hypothetical protein
LPPEAARQHDEISWLQRHFHPLSDGGAIRGHVLTARYRTKAVKSEAKRRGTPRDPQRVSKSSLHDKSLWTV